MNAVLEYNRELATPLKQPPRMTTTFQTGEGYLDEMLKQAKPEILLLTGKRHALPEKAEVLFYALLQVGTSEIFPVPDICLAAFNLLAARRDLAEMRVLCLDTWMLPSAVLARGQGARVFLAPGLDLGGLGAVLDYSGTAGDDFGDSLVLAGNPLQHMKNDADFTKKLQRCLGGVFLAWWDFLGVNLYETARRQWQHPALKSILQIPRPRRQGVVYYPALIELDRQNSHGNVRMAAISKIGPGPGSLSQSMVIQLLTAEPDGVDSVDVGYRDLYIDGLLDFTPKRFLHAAVEDEFPLQDVAYVTRCQFPRVKHDPKGEQKTTKTVFREITLANLDDRCGFVEPDTAADVIFPEKSPELGGRDAQYRLQANDIVMCFRGTEATLGKVGFIDTTGDMPMVCGQSLCIIRAHSVNPVWLYYHLRRLDVRQRILARSSGSTMLTVNLGDLRNLPIARQDAEVAALYEERHGAIVRIVQEIRRLYARMNDEMRAFDTHGDG
jgi:hypothetical protein